MTDYEEIVRLRERVQDLTTALKTALSTAPQAQERHVCQGCGRPWGIPEGFLHRGVELCGDCWRKAQPILQRMPVTHVPPCPFTSKWPLCTCGASASQEPPQDVPQTQCPKCGKWLDDHDGFGVLHHADCGYCSHASVTGDICGLCGKRVASAPQTVSTEALEQLAQRVEWATGPYLADIAKDIRALAAPAPPQGWQQERLAEAESIITAIIYASDGCVGHRNCNHSVEPWQRARRFISALPAPPASPTPGEEKA